MFDQENVAKKKRDKKISEIREYNANNFAETFVQPS